MSLDIQMLENPIIRWIIEIGIKNSFGEILGLEVLKNLASPIAVRIR